MFGDTTDTTIPLGTSGKGGSRLSRFSPMSICPRSCDTSSATLSEPNRFLFVNRKTGIGLLLGLRLVSSKHNGKPETKQLLTPEAKSPLRPLLDADPQSWPHRDLAVGLRCVNAPLL